MSLKKEFRGSGKAKMLLQTALEHVKDQKLDPTDVLEVRLITSELQAPAIRFYLREGFTLVRKQQFAVLRGLVSVWIYIFCHKI